MEPIYWYCISYVVGSVTAGYLCYRYAVERTVYTTLTTLVDEHYIRTRLDSNGDIDLIRLPLKYRTKKPA